jgi:hypothetical protein
VIDRGGEGADDVPELEADDTIRVDRARRADAAAAGATGEDAVESTTWPPPHLVDTDTRPSVRGERALLADPAAGEPASTEPDLGAGDAPGAGRRAYSPDHEALRTRYAARPAAPVMAPHAGLPARMAQPAVDGEAVDRSVRGKARRRVAWVGAWIAGAVVCAAGLLAILIASFLR